MNVLYDWNTNGSILMDRTIGLFIGTANVPNANAEQPAAIQPHISHVDDSDSDDDIFFVCVFVIFVVVMYQTGNIYRIF